MGNRCLCVLGLMVRTIRRDRRYIRRSSFKVTRIPQRFYELLHLLIILDLERMIWEIPNLLNGDRPDLLPFDFVVFFHFLSPFSLFDLFWGTKKADLISTFVVNKIGSIPAFYFMLPKHPDI